MCARVCAIRFPIVYFPYRGDNYIHELTDGIRELYAVYKKIQRRNPNATLRALFTHYHTKLPRDEHPYFIGGHLFAEGIRLILNGAFHLEYTGEKLLLVRPDVFKSLSIPYHEILSCDDEDLGQICSYSIEFGR